MLFKITDKRQFHRSRKNYDFKLPAKNIKLNFYLILRKYPFQVLREHKQAAVAGADRFFAGMRHAFGKPAGMAVVMDRGGVLFELRVDKKYEHLAKNAFKRASQKLSGNYKVIEQEIIKPKETPKTIKKVELKSD